VPGDENVLVKVAPGAMVPEFHVPSLAVDVCAVVSLFVQATVPPTGTAIGLGAKAVVVRVLAPLTIDTVNPGVGDGEGDGDGDDGESLDDPQPSESANKSAIAVNRIADMYEYSFDRTTRKHRTVTLRRDFFQIA